MADGMTSAVRAGTPTGGGSAPEVWLRGNSRPALVLLAVTSAATILAAATVAVCRPPWWASGLVATACGVCLAGALTICWVASKPRLVRRGGVLEIRLSPLRLERIPLDVVECVFPGSLPMPGGGTADERRVGTLVLRLAERAAEWRSRPAVAWGAWEDGSVVFDGRWCEPLSQPLARDLSAKLLEARRQAGARP